MSGYIGQNLPYGTFSKQSFSIVRYNTNGNGDYQRTYGPLVQRVSNESSILVMCDRLLLEPVTDYTIVNNAVGGNLTQSIRFNDLLDFASLDSGAAGIKIQILYLGKELLTSSVPSIGNVQDVQLNNPQDGQLITYDATQQKWINANSNFVSEALAAAVEARIDNMENYVNGKISDLVAGAPATLDTLNELAEALGEDENFATTISTNIGVIQNNLDQEIAARFLAVSSEESARAAADAAIEVNLDNEIARAEAAEAALDLRVTDIEASNLPEILTRLDVAESNTDQNTFDISELNTSLASYLKIDGTTTMTGSLNLDNNSILIGQTDTSQAGEGIKITPTEFRLHYKNEIDPQRRREVYLDPEYIRLNLYDGDENVLSEISFSHSQGPTWTGTPTQPNHFTTKQYVDGQVGTKVSTSSLSPVALSGSYNDLNDKPNISVHIQNNIVLDDISNVSAGAPQEGSVLTFYPQAGVNGEWHAHLLSYDGLLNKPSLANVALSGSYNDLADKPNLSSSLDELSDVSINNPEPTNILAYTISNEGPHWTNKTAEALVSNVVSAVALSGSYNDLADKPNLDSYLKLDAETNTYTLLGLLKVGGGTNQGIILGEEFYNDNSYDTATKNAINSGGSILLYRSNSIRDTTVYGSTGFSSVRYDLNSPVPTESISEFGFSHDGGPFWSGTPTTDDNLTTKAYVDSVVSTKVESSSLSTVALSGSYNDLNDVPTLISVGAGAVLSNTDEYWNDHHLKLTYEADGIVTTAGLAKVALTGSYNDLNDKPVGSLITTEYQEFPGGSKVFDYIMTPEVSSKNNGDLVLSSYYPGAQGSKIKLSNSELSSQIDFYTKSTLYGEDLAMSIESGGRVSANLGAIVSQPDKTQAVLKLEFSSNLGPNETQHVIVVNDGSAVPPFAVNSAGVIESAQITFLLNKIAELEARIEALENPVGV